MIEDIAHQCGHTLFYTLTHDTQKHLKVPKSTPLKDFNLRDNEYRDVYSAFHGNFTFTTIFHCLDKVFDSNTLIGEDKIELMARIGFNLNKFAINIQDFEQSDKLLTKEGIRFYECFVESYLYIKNKYLTEVWAFKYFNQSYSFNFEKFKQIN